MMDFNIKIRVKTLHKRNQINKKQFILSILLSPFFNKIGIYFISQVKEGKAIDFMLAKLF